jgi:signal transduction histidine kinase
VAEEAGAVLRFHRPRRPVEFFGHRQLIAQALVNLIENAIRYGASGNDIEVTVNEAGRRISIAVADHGPGIPEERREEALRRFGRLDSSRSEGGAGLGLALVRAIAHLHGGELFLENNQPGLRAVFDVPFREPEPSPESRA